ncbi:hypothetical protein QR680_010101 [Steinernema hermaphroditum]|uniref:Uncharacterized protein n=1 Tax=Steinernema hermaphroditum TaxID=289476 RepID=A0AA39IMQ5_9BILA|nr:hypothetical protein QR680_010101 [Steinernema hermaphroditum]
MMQAASSSVAKKLTNVLFAHMRGGFSTNDRHGEEILRCPRCADRLEAMCLTDFVDTDGATYQHIWWTCRGLRDDSCDYPLDMPTNVFWVKRTMQQRQEGFVPLPNINLLPKKYRSLYPTLFPKEAHRKKNRKSQKKTNLDVVAENEVELAELRSEGSRESRCTSPSSEASQAVQSSRSCSRLSFMSSVSANSSNGSKRVSVEERLPTPEREIFKKLCIPVAPHCRPRDTPAADTATPSTSSQPKHSPEKAPAVSKKRIESVFEGLTDIADEVETEPASQQAEKPSDIVKKLAKPAVPGVPEVDPSSPNASRPISTAPHSSTPSQCLETVRRETVVPSVHSITPRDLTKSEKLREKQRRNRMAIEQRAQKIFDATSTSIQVKDLDNVHIREDSSKRKRVDIFDGPECTLKSLLYMRYATGDFLHAVQRKLTKEGIGQPFTAMTPQQKRMAAEMASNIRKEHGSNPQGPSWLERRKLTTRRVANTADMSPEESVDEAGPSEKRAKPNLSESMATAEEEDFTELRPMTPRRLRTSQRLSAAHLTKHMLDREKERFAHAMSWRIGLNANKVTEEAPHVTPPRAPSTSSEQNSVPLAGNSAETQTRAPSTPTASTTPEEYEDDLSDIPDGMKLTRFNDPELDALLARKLRKVCQENVIYDKDSNLLYVPANINYVVPSQPATVEPEPEQHAQQDAFNEPDYMPSGLATDPNADLHYDDYNFLNPTPMDQTGMDNANFQGMEDPLQAHDNISSDGMWHDLGFGMSGMDSQAPADENTGLYDEFGLPLDGSLQGLNW